MATEELRQEFGQMADRGMSPSEFGLRVRSHPAGLMITAAGKMRNGTRMTVSYSGDITETISFEREPSVNRRNHERFDRFILSLGPSQTDPSGNHVWRGVGGTRVADLLEELVVHPGSRKARGDHLARYIRAQNGIGGLTSWTVALISNLRGTAVELGGLTVGAVRRAQHLPDHSDADAVYRIRRLVSPTDEMIDLLDEQRKRALARTVRQHEDDPEASRHRGSAVQAQRPQHPPRSRPREWAAAAVPAAGDGCGWVALRGLRRELPQCRGRHAGRLFRELGILAGGTGDLNLAETWRLLEEDGGIAGVSGRVQRRIMPAGRRNVFLGLEMPAGNRMLILRVSASSLHGQPDPPASPWPDRAHG